MKNFQLQSDQLTASQHTRALHIKHVEELVTARCMILIKNSNSEYSCNDNGQQNSTPRLEHKTLYHFQPLYGLNFEGR